LQGRHSPSSPAIVTGRDVRSRPRWRASSCSTSSGRPRPVACFVAFTAISLHDTPDVRDRLVGGDGSTLEAFAHEVRRRYPFVPMLAARAVRDHTSGEEPILRGERVLLDVYGTPDEGHRCPGERIAIELIKVAARFLAGLDYKVP
jgi:fatty-acid peroxygenase